METSFGLGYLRRDWSTSRYVVRIERKGYTYKCAGTYRTFQLEKLSNCGYSRRPWSISDGSVYESAFDNIHRMPCRVFDRNQQISIVNCVSEGLSEDAQLLKDRVKLLIKFLVHPNKDFNVLRFPSGHLADSKDQSVVDRKPFLVNLAELFHSCCHHCYVDTEAIELLKLLTHQILKYVFESRYKPSTDLSM